MLINNINATEMPSCSAAFQVQGSSAQPYAIIHLLCATVYRGHGFTIKRHENLQRQMDFCDLGHIILKDLRNKNSSTLVYVHCAVVFACQLHKV